MLKMMSDEGERMMSDEGEKMMNLGPSFFLTFFYFLK